MTDMPAARETRAHELYNRAGQGARDDAAAMQFIVPGWIVQPEAAEPGSPADMNHAAINARIRSIDADFGLDVHRSAD
jgi:hypothetical protein